MSPRAVIDNFSEKPDLWCCIHLVYDVFLAGVLATWANAQNLTPLSVQMFEVDPTKLPALIAADEGHL